MRILGRIDWFGGFDYKKGRENTFGFVKDLQRNRYFIHQNNLDKNCKKENLEEKIFVTFKVRDNTNGNKKEAYSLRLLVDEEDPETLEYVFNRKNKYIYENVIDKYLKTLNKEEAIQKLKMKLELLEDENEKQDLIDKIDLDFILKTDEFYKYFSLDKKIQLFLHFVSEKDQKAHKLWKTFVQQEKIYTIYYFMKNDLPLNIFYYHSKTETNVLVKALMNLSEIALRKNNKNINQNLEKEIFLKFHILIENYVIDLAQDFDKQLDIKGIFPRCKYYKNHYCEGIDNKSYSLCYLRSSNCYQEIINPNIERSYKMWTVREVLDKYDINVFHPEVKDLDNDKYIQKMASWINRFNAIRSRLKCSKCETPFKVDLNYSKFSRKFSTTIFDCPNDVDGHDKKIYLNVCWACGKIIDSRESRIRVEDYYVCKNCGSGPQITYDYTQGDICPNCGGKEMKKSSYREMTCESCNHTITLPFRNKIIGKNKEKLMQKVYYK